MLTLRRVAGTLDTNVRRRPGRHLRTSFVVSLTGARTPGPLLTVTMQESVLRIIDRCVHQGLPPVCGVNLIALGGRPLAFGIGHAA